MPLVLGRRAVGDLLTLNLSLGQLHQNWVVQINLHFYWGLVDVAQRAVLSILVAGCFGRACIVTLPVLLREQNRRLARMLILNYFLVKSVHDAR